MPLTRRVFLRQTSLLLAGLGISETALAQYSRQFQQALAEPTSRKLALLVGINTYDQVDLPDLKGCITDLDLQRELLIHQFGFQEQDILILKDRQATRSHIEGAYTDHLLNQAESGDVVLFHFSGYGRYLRNKLPAELQPTTKAAQRFPALVLADNPSQSKMLSLPEGNDLLLETLRSWLRSLRTEQITTVLDTGFAYPGASLRGHLRVRSVPEAVLPMIMPPPLPSARTRGLSLEAATAPQTAMEAQWHDFAAGLFTYALTRQLWQSTLTTSPAVHFNNITTAVARQTGMDPHFHWGQGNGQEHSPLSEVVPLGPPTEGVVQSVEKDMTTTLWLAGLSPEVLEQYGSDSCFQVLPLPQRDLSQARLNASPLSAVDAQPGPQEPPLYVRLQSHRGLKATGELLGPGQLQVGQRLQEVIRVLPRTIPLTVALDPNLDRIERVDATSAFSELSRIAVVSGEPSSDCLFTTTSSTSSQESPLPEQVASAEGSHNHPVTTTRYGLSYPAGVSFAHTQGEAGEAIKTAVRRLKPALKALLAAKMLQLTINSQSSRLRVRALLEVVKKSEDAEIAIQQSTSRALVAQADPIPTVPTDPLGGLITLPIGSHIRYRIHNEGDRPCYWLLLCIDNSSQVFAFFPSEPTSPSAEQAESIPSNLAGRVNPGETITVPAATEEAWGIRHPVGLTTAYLVCCHQPFEKTAAVMATQLPGALPAKVTEVLSLPKPLEVVQHVLEDLHDASVNTVKAIGLPQESNWALAAEDWATLPFVYSVEST